MKNFVQTLELITSENHEGNSKTHVLELKTIFSYQNVRFKIPEIRINVELCSES